MADLHLLEERIRQSIPLTRHLDFSLAGYDDGALSVKAPLAPNVNDKGTFFAGSQAALVTLAGWSLTTLEAEAQGSEANVVAVESSLRYVAPLTGMAMIRASANQEALTLFRQRYARRGKAVLTVTVQIRDPQGKLTSEFDGIYLARKM